MFAGLARTDHHGKLVVASHVYSKSNFMVLDVFHDSVRPAIFDDVFVDFSISG